MRLSVLFGQTAEELATSPLLPAGLVGTGFLFVILGIGIVRRLISRRGTGTSSEAAFGWSVGSLFLLGGGLLVGSAFGELPLLLGGTLVSVAGFASGMRLAFPEFVSDSSKSKREPTATLFRELLEDLDQETLKKLNHEFRTPLTAVMGYLELMAGDHEFYREGGRRMETLQTLRLNTRRLLALVDNLTELGEADQTISAPPIPVSTRNLLEEIFRDPLIQNLAANVDLSARMAPNVPSEIAISPHDVHMVLKQLVQNAVQYSDKGAAEVQVGYDSGNELLTLTVRDQGIGISPQLLQKIRDGVPFSTVDGRDSGMGLGLWLAGKLTRRCGGTIDIQSALGTGTTVSITFPVTIGRQERSSRQSEDAKNTTIPSVSELRGKRLLIVEEDQFDREVLYSALKSSDAKVEIAESASAGHQLVESARRQLDPYQLVLVGVPLQDGNSTSFLRELREIDRYLPVLAISDQHSDEDWRESLCAGFDDYLAKPVQTQSLIELCHVWSRKSGPPPILSS